MRAMVLKEFRQMRRDRRTLALMIAMPLMLLVVFGYAARFDVTSIETAVVGPGATATLDLDPVFAVTTTDATADRERGEQMLRDGDAQAVLVAGRPAALLLDGSQLFTAQSALRRVPAGTVPEVLFNPDLDTARVMVPALIGLVLLFVGTVITSLGVVREREQGTLEQLAVMPLSPLDVTIGKIAPYFLVAVVDMVVITLAGIWLFDVPFEGSLPFFAVVGLVYVFVVLGLGVAISTVSASQGEAIQLAIMTLLPQIMLSGMIFPLESVAAGVRWIGYLLPLTWFVEVARSLMLKGTASSALLVPLGILALMAVVVLGVAIGRFRRDLAPSVAASGDGHDPAVPTPVAAS